MHLGTRQVPKIEGSHGGEHSFPSSLALDCVFVC